MGLLIDVAVILLAFTLIIVLVLKRYDINIAILVSVGILLAYYSGYDAPRIVFNTISDDRMWFLLAMSFTIAFLAVLYKETGFIEELSSTIVYLIKNPVIAIIVLPAVIGLLPIAGGALMSAPVVGVLCEKLGYSVEQAIFFNVWFRHVLFMVYPLGQALIIAAITTGFDPISLAIVQLPIALFMLLSGAFFLRKTRKPRYGVGGDAVNTVSWSSGAPLLLSILASLVLARWNTLVGMPLGVLFGVLSLLYLTGFDKRIVGRALKSRVVWSLSLAAFSILFLQHSIMDTRASTVFSELMNNGIPIILLETIVPGIISGLTSSPITGIIIVAPLISALKPISLLDASLLYTSSFIIYTISPTHLCLIFTAKYFSRGIISSYRYFIPAATVTVVLTILYYWIRTIS